MPLGREPDKKQTAVSLVTLRGGAGMQQRASSDREREPCKREDSSALGDLGAKWVGVSAGREGSPSRCTWPLAFLGLSST